MHIDLTGKTALVTGGSGAIGRAICLSLARAGVSTVAFTFFSNHEGADETAKALAALGCEPLVLRANLADEGGPDRVLGGLAGLAAVDIFVSNAASGVLRPALELNRKHWRWTMNTNAQSMLRLAQGLLIGDPPLMGAGGRIVTLSSLGAVRALPNYTLIGASKAALEALSRGLAAELGPGGITVNVVSPGLVDTWSLRQFPDCETLIEFAEARTPAGRLTEPADVAGLVTFLCGPQAAMITGQTLVVDGGYSVVS